MAKLPLAAWSAAVSALPSSRLSPPCSQGPHEGSLRGFRLGQLARDVSVRGGARRGCRLYRLPLGDREMAMKDPVHPGAIVREDCLKPLGLSVSEGAKRLGVGRQTLSNLVNEKSSVSPTCYRRRSARPPRRDSACSWPSTLPARVIWNRRSRSNESSPHRHPSTSTSAVDGLSIIKMGFLGASRAVDGADARGDVRPDQ